MLIGIGTMAAFVAMGPRTSSTEQFYIQTILMTISMTVLIPSAVWVLFDMIGRVPSLWGSKPWRLVTVAARIMAAVAFVLMICGIFNHKRLTVKRLEISFSDLPASYDGLTIAHISDLHLGSMLGDTTYIARVVDRINSLAPDLIVFTGDIVSRRSDELKPFVGQLSRLHAPLGCYAVMGNHDYARYVDYDTPADRHADRLQLYDLYRRTSLTLLRDSCVTVVNAHNDTLLIAGTENISHPPFPSYGSLHDAIGPQTHTEAFTIVLSHDPTMWNDSIRNAPDLRIPLTLSGHTHAMQCQMLGLTPSWIRDPLWGNLYTSADSMRRININTGIGTVGPLMRIGATPQISLITLRTKQ